MSENTVLTVVVNSSHRWTFTSQYTLLPLWDNAVQADLQATI